MSSIDRDDLFQESIERDKTGKGKSAKDRKRIKIKSKDNMRG